MNEAPIIICYDDSEDSRRAIEAAAELLPNRRAVVLDVGPVVTPEQAYASAAFAVPGFEEENLADAAARAQRGVDHALTHGIRATAKATVEAPIWQGILDVADQTDAAVIVIGSRGLHGLREAVEGSLSHDVSDHSHRPVLVVPPAA
jgi:nucleotide-binding universal stress UspA family protein